jgi:hypothetical protein
MGAGSSSQTSTQECSRFLPQSQTSSTPKCIPVEPLGVNLGADTGKVWTEIEFIGEGEMGTVTQVCAKCDSEKTVCHFVLKYTPLSIIVSADAIRREIDTSILMGDMGIGPKVYDSWMCASGGAFVMEKLDMSLQTFLATASRKQQIAVFGKIKNLVAKMASLDLEHGDLHENNIMVNTSPGRTSDDILVRGTTDGSIFVRGTTDGSIDVRFIDFFFTKTTSNHSQSKLFLASLADKIFPEIESDAFVVQIQST